MTVTSSVEVLPAGAGCTWMPFGATARLGSGGCTTVVSVAVLSKWPVMTRCVGSATAVPVTVPAKG